MNFYKYLFRIIIFLIFFTLSTYTTSYAELHAYPNQPDGFGGFTWGTTLDEFPTSSSVLIYSGIDREGYTDITYLYKSALFNFVNNKLYTVDIVVSDYESYCLMKNKLPNIFGPGDECYKKVDGTNIFIATEWFGTKTFIAIPPYTGKHTTITFMDAQTLYKD